MVNTPSPALVSQQAVKRLPRWALLSLCFTYVLMGLFGHSPWKPFDITTFGYMWSLAQGQTNFMNLSMAGLAPELDALLPYWLGSLSLQIFHNFMPADLAARIPFALLSLLGMACTWQAIYHLARNPHAQPVAFAFGGEASPKDYARSLADAGLLANLACLGLALPSHEMSPMSVQLSSMSIIFVGASMQAFYPRKGLIFWSIGIVMLALSGAPAVAVLTGLGTTFLWYKHPQALRIQVQWMCALILGLVALSFAMELWRWRLLTPRELVSSLRASSELWIWFLWPAWPLALWTLWRWRGHWDQQMWSQHLILPLMLFGISSLASLLTADPDRTLLLTLPSIAALAAFALPTLQRSVSALIDWFTLLFFTGGAVAIWGVWVSLETGLPAQPALNVQRLVPGFVHQFETWSFVIALIASVAWIKLVMWRVGRHPTVIWKSLVLPATGATLCWTLLMTLWLPILDRALSYKPWSQELNTLIPPSTCVYASGLERSQIAGLGYHAQFDFKAYAKDHHAVDCQWLFVRESENAQPDLLVNKSWRFKLRSKRPSDKNETILIYQQDSTP
jgi:hypothetical protein